jgi:hypothetical protein
MGVVAVNTFNMPCRRYWRLPQIMHVTICSHVMTARFGNLCFYVCAGNGTVVTDKTILLGVLKMKQAFIAAG